MGHAVTTAAPVTPRRSRPRLLRIYWRNRWPAAMVAIFMDGREWPSLIAKLNAVRALRIAAGDIR